MHEPSSRDDSTLTPQLARGHAAYRAGAYPPAPITPQAILPPASPVARVGRIRGPVAVHVRVVVEVRVNDEGIAVRVEQIPDPVSIRDERERSGSVRVHHEQAPAVESKGLAGLSDRL